MQPRFSSRHAIRNHLLGRRDPRSRVAGLRSSPRLTLAVGLCAALLIDLFLLVGSGGREHAAAQSVWQARDTAAYAVSTLNLLHTRSGINLVTFWRRLLSPISYAVYRDTRTQSLFFIRILGDHRRITGTFAYRLGWRLPKPIAGDLLPLRRHAVRPLIAHAYRADPKQLVGIFSSTRGFR